MMAPRQSTMSTLRRNFHWNLLLCAIVFMNSSTTTDADDMTTTHTAGSSGENSTYAEDSERYAMARLMTYIKELPVAKGKVAPIVNDSTGKPKVIVSTTLVAFAVVGVNDVQQTVTTSGYIMLYWQDKALSWNRSQYGGLDTIEVPLEWIWTPQIFVGNSMDYQNLLNRDGMLVIVGSDGWVLARTFVIMSTYCKLDLTNYPFDSQICPIFFTSFSKLVHWVVNTKYEANLSQEYSVGSEWELLSFKAVLQCMQGYAERGPHVVVEMRRKTTFYVVCLVLPMVLTSYMNTLVFLLPLQSGEKVSFLISIFVSTSVFVSYFTSVMPRGLDSVPNTMKLLIGVINESLIVFLATILVLRHFHQQTTDAQEPENTSSLTSFSSFPLTTMTMQTEKTDMKGKGSTTDNLHTDEIGDVTFSQEKTSRISLCCSTNSRVHSSRATSELTSKVELQNEKDFQDTFTSLPQANVRRAKKATAEQLDRLFFLVTFVGNTVFLAVLLSQAVSV